MVLNDLRRLFVIDLERRLAVLEDALARAEADPSVWLASGKAIAAELHDVKGTGATLGFADISATARRMERQLADDPPPSTSDLRQGLNEMRAAAGLIGRRHRLTQHRE